MQSETKQCQNCKSDFVIEPDDFAFYEKIKVPAPTFCPDCRLQRRLAFFNLRTLYKRVCDLCKKEKISMYPPEAPYKVYCPRCWWSDNWDPLDYGQDYDFSKPFFFQFDELWHKVPLLGLSIGLECVDTSPYNNHTGHLKDCYLLFKADFNEDCAYGTLLVYNKMLIDCSMASKCELSYDCKNNFKNSRCIGADNTIESLECIFTRDCTNCQNCFASANLRGKKYHIFNKPYSKEGYFQEIKKWDLGSYKQYQESKKLAEEHWKKFPPKPRFDEHSVDITGNYVFESKNCKECFETVDSQDCKYLLMLQIGPVRDCYDISSWGNNMELCYEACVVGENISNVKFAQESGIVLQNAEYCKLSTGGSDHFGCVSMKKGKFIIFNKAYAETDYQKLKEKIINHMKDTPYTDKAGRIYMYGEFFPIELSPFPYNTTVAQDFFPLTQEKIIQEGYIWRDFDVKEYSITKPTKELPDNIKDAPLNILQETLGCSKCGKGFRIIQMEFDFLKKMNLPLPRECPFCRIDKKMNQWVKQLKLTTRICDKCKNEFQTPHTKENFEKILCKKCYLEEVV